MGDSICILGAGITGLAAAYVLSPNYKITVIARDLPGDINTDWASPWAGAVFHPQRDATPSQRQMQRTSFHFYQALAAHDPSSGVKIYPMTEYLDDSGDDSDIWYKTLMPEYRIIPTEELPAGVKFGMRYMALAIYPGTFLPWLKQKLSIRGVEFIRAEVRDFGEARKLTGAKIIVNATGVGARTLAADDTVMPVRGQTMFVKTDFSECVMREGKDYTYVIPRSGTGGVILGGVKSDRLDIAVDFDLKSDILARVNQITQGAFEGVDLAVVTDLVGFRPGRKGGLKVEKEGNVIHAYGVGGAGYIYSFGIAEEIKRLVKDVGSKARL